MSDKKYAEHLFVLAKKYLSALKCKTRRKV